MPEQEPSFPTTAITGAVLVLEDLAQPRRWLCEVVREAWPQAGWIDEAEDLQAARQLLQVRRYQVALLDWELPDGNAATLIDSIASTSPQTLVVVSTIHDDDDRVFAALRAGAQGYILKSQWREPLLAQLRALERGEPALSPAIAHKVLAYFRSMAQASDVGDTGAAAAPALLSPRETDVLRLLANGYRNAEAAEQLGITLNTLGGYIKTVYRKLGVSSRAEAALKATRMGLVR